MIIMDIVKRIFDYTFSLETTKNVEKIVCSSALNKLKRKIPYGWDLNIYRGCNHQSKYCYALYTHEYLKEKDFSKIFAKTNIKRRKL